MPFLGNQPQQGFANSVVKDNFTPNGSTTAFTLSKSAASANDIEVYVGNVRQEPTDAYSVSGTTLTMSEAVATGMNFYVLHVQGTVESSIAPQSNSVGTGIIQNNAVTGAKIASTISTNHTFSGSLTVPAATSAYQHIKTIEGSNVSSVDFLHGSNGVTFDNTFDMYEFVVHYAYNAATGRDFRVLPSQDGSSFSVSNTECIRYRSIFESGSAGSGAANATNLGVWRSYLNIGGAVDDPITARIQVAHPYDSDKRTIFLTDAGGRDPSNYYREIASGNPTSAGRTYGARFQAETGNCYAKVSLYGLKTA